MNVFLGVILSVFKRSVACPGHGLLQHVYGVTITCSSWFYIKKGHREEWTPGNVVVGRSTPGFLVLTQSIS